MKTKYARAAGSEEEESTLYDPVDTSGGRPWSRWKRLAFLTILAAIAVKLVFMLVKESNAVYKDKHIWPCHSASTPSVRTVARSKFGNVYSLDLTDDYKVSKESPMPGESRYSYETDLGVPKLDAKQGILCIYRLKAWWMKPAFLIDSFEEMPLETLFVLGKDETQENMYRLLMSIILPDNIDGQEGYTSSSLKVSTADDSSLRLTSETGGTVGLYSGMAENPFNLIDEGVAMAAKMAAKNSNTSPEDEKTLVSNTNRLPRFCQRLGWCTWNAFYTDFTGTKILDGVKWLHEQGKIPVRWMIIDDGWQSTTVNDTDTHSERLADLGANRDKFGNGKMSLEETLQELKQSPKDGGMGIESVFAWHAYSGYWMGLEPSNSRNNMFKSSVPPELQLPSASLYYPEFSTGIMTNDPGQDWGISLGVGEADNAQEFYDKYYAFMTSVGLDGVKVDVQGFTGSLKPSGRNKETYRHRHQLSTRLGTALSSSIVGHFDEDKTSANIIHCMCHAPELFFRIPSLYNKTMLPLMRASDDFWPDDPSTHGPMVAALAFNSLLLGRVAITDWDMFQTILPDTKEVSGYQVAKLHAVARSISGGPVYISDVPGATNASLIDSVVCHDGTILPCSSVGQPIRDSLLRDPLEANGPPLIIWNTNGIPGGQVTSGVLGLFNLASSSHLGWKSSHSSLRATTTVQVRPSDIEAFRSNLGDSFLAISHNSKKARLLSSADDSIQIDIPSSELLWCDVIAMIPIITIPLSHGSLSYDVVPLGINGKFNSAGAVIRTATDTGANQTKIDLSVRGCGMFGTLVRLRSTAGHINSYEFTAKVEINGTVVSQTEFPVQSKEAASIVDFGEDGFVLITFELLPDPMRQNEERWVSVVLTE